MRELLAGAIVSDRRLAMLERFYAADWADRPSRRLALLALSDLSGPEFEWVLAWRAPPVRLGKPTLDLIGREIESDFSTCRHAPGEVRLEESDQLHVLGWVCGRTRCSRQQVRRRFEDSWSFVSDRPARLVSR
jgi:hypothetical protein